MACSLPSSQTLKSFWVRSRTYSPFLSVTTLSTRTRRVSARITPASSAPGALGCWAYTSGMLEPDSRSIQKLARQIRPVKRTSRRWRILHLQDCCLTNLNGPVLCGHHLPFRVPYHKPYHIAPRLYVEAGLERDSWAEFVLQSFIFPVHGHCLLYTLDEVAIAIEQSRHTG